MDKLTFYEQTGIIVPGSVLLLGLSLLFPNVRAIFASDGISVGGLGLFLIVAYACGHLVAAIGNAIEVVFWRCFGGMPSSWVTRASSSIVNDEQVDKIAGRIRSRLGLTVSSIGTLSRDRWQPIFGQLYRDVLAHNPGRVETFNGNYGLNRGLAAATATLALATIVVESDKWSLALASLLASGIFLCRMYRFGVHFAREVYHCFLALPD